MDNEKFSGKWKSTTINLENIKEIIDELVALNTEEIHLAGSGDPTMHPDFIQVIEYIKKKGLRINLNTNFTLLTKKKLKKLVELNLDYITVSLWAGDAETYVETHPNQTEKTFYKIKENLKYLHSIKKEENLPHLKIYNVISNKNFDNIESMVDFALDTKVDFIEFQVIDIVKGKTDVLSLESKHKNTIIEQFDKIKEREDYFTELIGTSHLKYVHPHHRKEFMEFGRFFKKTLPEGFKLDFKNQSAICPHGIHSNKMTVDQKKRNAFIFYFSEHRCDKCNPEGFFVKEEFLNLLGYGSLKRRISSKRLGQAQYEINIVDTMPCYVGWTYSRILVNGDVIPCCKGVNKPLGNIYDKTFSEIWFSHIYDEFRKLAKTKKKSYPYFKEIECYKSCDNVGMNLQTHIMMKQNKK